VLLLVGQTDSQSCIFLRSQESQVCQYKESTNPAKGRYHELCRVLRDYRIRRKEEEGRRPDNGHTLDTADIIVMRAKW
jgi:hypothetical protein